MTDLQTPTARETAALAVLERYCVPKEGRADANTHLAWMASVFARNPDLYGDDEDGRRAMRDMLMLSCDPRGRFDGVTAREIAGKILAALGTERGAATLNFAALLAAVGCGALLSCVLEVLR